MNLLHIGIYSDQEPQRALRNALRGISDSYKEFDWRDIVKNFSNAGLNGLMLDSQADTIFMQIQSPNIIKSETVKVLKERGVKIFNFTGDVRQPLPQWYIDLAPYVTTLFTNETDVDVLRGLGYNSHYFQIGYDSAIYNPEGEKSDYEIVFMGNNYGNFPLSEMRSRMVEHLEERYEKRFQVFGTGWKNGINLNFKQKEEAKVYRGCRVAINLSHFDLKRYSSDRMLRIMGCGAMCLSHGYQLIEKDFSNGEHLGVWRDFDELDYMIDYCMDSDYTPLIARQGQRLVSDLYTWNYRMTQLKTIIHELDRRNQDAGFVG